MKISYFTTSLCENLEAHIKEHAEWYCGSSIASPPEEAVSDERVRESELEMEDYRDQLDTRTSDLAEADISNSITVYEAMKSLTRHQAADKRLWIHETHRCQQYVTSRWKSELAVKPGQSLEDKHINAIKNHYFVPTTRELRRGNAIARLWWCGKIANKAVPEDPKNFLEVIFAKQDIRAQLVERPSMASNIKTLRSIYEILSENLATDEQALFNRATFRTWMKALNRKGGYLLLDAMSDTSRNELFRKEAEKAMQG